MLNTFSLSLVQHFITTLIYSTCTNPSMGKDEISCSSDIHLNCLENWATKHYFGWIRRFMIWHLQHFSTHFSWGTHSLRKGTETIWHYIQRRVCQIVFSYSTNPPLAIKNITEFSLCAKHWPQSKSSVTLGDGECLLEVTVWHRHGYGCFQVEFLLPKSTNLQETRRE